MYPLNSPAISHLFPNESRWYALSVKPRHEKAVGRLLDQKTLTAFVPAYQARRRWSDRVKTTETCLFPGYVFCRFGFPDRMQVLGTPGVLSVISFGRNPAPIPEEEIGAVRSVIASGRPIQPWPYLKLGQKVRIDEGCLEGLMGTLVRERDVCRVVISVEILERSVAVEIDRSLLSPIPAALDAGRRRDPELVCQS
jgi:transcription antitermination factor NusG